MAPSRQPTEAVDVPTTYLVFKTIHVIAAVVFVGNIVVTAVWKALADRTRDPRVIAFGQRLVTLTDYVFTAPSAVVVLASGLMLMSQYRVPLWQIPWLLWGLLLFAVSGALWVAVLIPVQVKQARVLRNAIGGVIPEDYWRLGRRWMIAGTAATVLPLINVYLMVMKPS